MEKQTDIIDQIFANIDYLNNAMCVPLAELTNRLFQPQPQEDPIDPQNYQEWARDIVGLVKGLDNLIDNLPQLETETPEIDDKLNKLIERNTIVNQKLQDIMNESGECLHLLYSIDDDIKTQIINTKK